MSEQIRYCKEEQAINQKKFDTLRQEQAKINHKSKGEAQQDDYLHQTLVEQVLALEEEHRSRKHDFKQIKNRAAAAPPLKNFHSLSSRVFKPPTTMQTTLTRVSQPQRHQSLKNWVSDRTSLHDSRNSNSS